jgi:hypothetical protein
MMRDAVLRIAALFSYCGGPLFIADLLKTHFSMGPVFLITFLPVGLMVVGAFFLNDDVRDRVSFALVWAGRQGLYIVLGMHLYALWCFVHGVCVPDQRLHYLGIAVGAAWSVAYLHAARRWVSSPGGSSHAAHNGPTKPIEPS